MNIHIEVDDIDFFCRHCDSAMILTDCQSPYCTGYRCLACERGCDLAYVDGGLCATDLADASDTQLHRRLRQKRLAIFYHRPVTLLHRPLRTVELPGEDA